MQEFDIYMIIVILILWHVVVKMMITISDVIIIASTNDGYIRLHSVGLYIQLYYHKGQLDLLLYFRHDSVRV